MSMSEMGIERKLASVNKTQESIQSMSLWVMHQKSHYKKIINIWLRLVKQLRSKRLVLFYLCNDIVQNSKKKAVPHYKDYFRKVLPEAVSYVSKDSEIVPNIERILGIWQDRGVFKHEFIKELKATIVGSRPAVKKPAESEPAVPAVEEDDDDEDIDLDEDDNQQVDVKPAEVADQIRSVTLQAETIHRQKKQVDSLKLDASSIDAIKQLKDRTHGEEFCTRFDESQNKLQSYVGTLRENMSQRAQLIKKLVQAHKYYKTQNTDAREVASAFKNYGMRVAHMKKKLDELLTSMESPMPSPPPAGLEDAPSPGNTPPHLRPEDHEPCDMDVEEEKIETGGVGLGAAASLGLAAGVPGLDQESAVDEFLQRARQALEQRTASVTAVVANNSPPSPEASPITSGTPNPEKSSQEDEQSRDTTDDVTKQTNKGSDPLAAIAAINNEKYSNDDSTTNQGGGGTPLMDEDGSATPVQDEAQDDPGSEETSSSQPIAAMNFLTSLIARSQQPAAGLHPPLPHQADVGPPLPDASPPLPPPLPSIEVVKPPPPIPDLMSPPPPPPPTVPFSITGLSIPPPPPNLVGSQTVDLLSPPPPPATLAVSVSPTPGLLPLAVSSGLAGIRPAALTSLTQQPALPASLSAGLARAGFAQPSATSTLAAGLGLPPTALPQPALPQPPQPPTPMLSAVTSVQPTAVGAVFSAGLAVRAAATDAVSTAQSGVMSEVMLLQRQQEQLKILQHTHDVQQLHGAHVQLSKPPPPPPPQQQHQMDEWQSAGMNRQTSQTSQRRYSNPHHADDVTSVAGTQYSTDETTSARRSNLTEIVPSRESNNSEQIQTISTRFRQPQRFHQSDFRGPSHFRSDQGRGRFPAPGARPRHGGFNRFQSNW